MSKQIINTDGIKKSANQLRMVNTKINTAFDDFKNKAKQLNNNWNSRAGEKAKTTMYQLFNYNEARSAVLQNYINMLEQQVNPGYKEAENVNVQLSDLFK